MVLVAVVMAAVVVVVVFLYRLEYVLSLGSLRLEPIRLWWHVPLMVLQDFLFSLSPCTLPTHILRAR